MRKAGVYIIAEIGINHNGSLENCLKLIDAARDAGCDCAKFQFFKAHSLYPRSAGRLDWRNGNKSYSYDIYEAVESFELPEAWLGPIMDECAKEGIAFMSSVFDSAGARYLAKLGMKRIKLPSYAVTNIPLIEECARLGLPLIMSTGGSTLSEIKEAVAAVNGYHNDLALLHCVIKYPTPLDECNLGAIEALRGAFPDNTIGYSDHTEEASEAAVQAVYLGARIIEKHITLDRRMEGPDHFFALEVRELKEMVKDIKKAERDLVKGDIEIDKRLYGSSTKAVFDHEVYLRDFCFRTIFAARDIKKGERIRAEDLSVLRPGKKSRGLEPKYLKLFKEREIIASRDIPAEDAIEWEMIHDA